LKYGNEILDMLDEAMAIAPRLDACRHNCERLRNWDEEAVLEQIKPTMDETIFLLEEARKNAEELSTHFECIIIDGNLREKKEEPRS